MEVSFQVTRKLHEKTQAARAFVTFAAVKLKLGMHGDLGLAGQQSSLLPAKLRNMLGC